MPYLVYAYAYLARRCSALITHTHTHTHTHTYTHTHTHIHTHTHTYTHTNTHMHTQINPACFFLNDFFNRWQDIPLHCTFFNIIMFASKHSFIPSIASVPCIHSHPLKSVCDFPFFSCLKNKQTLAQYIQSCLWVIRKVQVFPTTSLFSFQQHTASSKLSIIFSLSLF